jgi:hypothetical protein
MILAELLLKDRQRILKAGLRLGVPLLLEVSQRQIVEGFANLRVILAERILPDRQRAFVKRLRFRVSALLQVHNGQPSERDRVVHVARSKSRLGNGLELLRFD